MTVREFYLPSSDGVSRLRCMEWIPDGTIRGIIQIVHGMTEHIERYREFAEAMAENQIAVYGHDHLGHGKTASPEDLGYFGDENGPVFLIKDVRRLTAYGKKKYPGIKHFLLGHSMGSFFSRRYLTIYNDGPDGVILMGTGGQPGFLVAVGAMLSSAVCAVKGSRYQSRLLHELSIGNYNRKFKPNVSGNDWLTRDVEQAKKYGADPLCQFIFTAGAYRDFFGIILKVSQEEKRKRLRTDLPVLFLSGDQDPVGGYSKGVRRVYDRYDKAGVEDLTIGLYKDCRHELLNEQNREEVWRDIRNWILDRADS